MEFQSDKPSTRVHAAPGGNSNFSLGWDEPAAPVRQQKNMYQSHAKQDAIDGYYGGAAQKQSSFEPQFKRIQPRTEHTIMENGNGITSVKIHAPPGGKSNFNIFGGQDEPVVQSKPALKQYDMNKNKESDHWKGAPDVPTFGYRVQSGNNAGPTTEKSSTRVHAPPGGHSNIFFC